MGYTIFDYQQNNIVIDNAITPFLSHEIEYAVFLKEFGNTIPFLEETDVTYKEDNKDEALAIFDVHHEFINKCGGKLDIKKYMQRISIKWNTVTIPLIITYMYQVSQLLATSIKDAKIFIPLIWATIIENINLSQTNYQFSKPHNELSKLDLEEWEVKINAIRIEKELDQYRNIQKQTSSRQYILFMHLFMHEKTALVRIKKSILTHNGFISDYLFANAKAIKNFIDTWIDIEVLRLPSVPYKISKQTEEKQDFDKLKNEVLQKYRWKLQNKDLVESSTAVFRHIQKTMTEYWKWNNIDFKVCTKKWSIAHIIDYITTSDRKRFNEIAQRLWTNDYDQSDWGNRRTYKRKTDIS